ncbi:MAG: HEPN domain-containing protein [Nanoarchaeota archaeon]|nr:HEPN domain-containing protein [Nanoarchaeota archaeon]MBU1321687.1 HEPN domain-containing protein [Nanoarchaeota archaeon]MBU1598072.1 HEPN domain-containing protein [Nanoarchaeota archaeon]MBU2441636.1 HEPN domain-containing protein [Nanoarchaeota archaeon]
MDSKLHIQRAENEIKLAEIIFVMSEKSELQTEYFDVKDPETYYSAVISHCYYAIFYAAKAYLIKKKIRVSAPEEHKKAFNEFKKFVESGELDVELLKIYQEALIRADHLLGIFKEEKSKRGTFTYRKMPQANKDPARDSLEHAKTFFKHINAIIC